MTFLQAQALNNRPPGLAWLNGVTLDDDDVHAVQGRFRASQSRQLGATFKVGATTISRLDDDVTFDAPTSDVDEVGRPSRVLVTTSFSFFEQEGPDAVASFVRDAAGSMGRTVLLDDLRSDLSEWYRKKARRGRLKRLGRRLIAFWAASPRRSEKVGSQSHKSD